MMKTKIFPLLILAGILFAPGFAGAQETTTENPGRRQVGLDVSSLIQQGGSPWITYKRHGERSTFRLRGRLAAQLSADGLRFNENERNDQYANLNGAIRIGKEWSRQFGRLRVFWGADLLVEGSLRKARILRPNADGTAPEDDLQISRASGVGLGISPLAGLNVFVMDRLSLGVETTAVLKGTYHYNNNEVERYELDPQTGAFVLQRSEYESSVTGVFANLYNDLLFNINFHF